MKKYSYLDKPLKICGIYDFENTKELRRLPDDVIEKVPSLSSLGLRTPGARLCFRTDSGRLTVRASLKDLSPDVGLPIFGCQSFYIFTGDRQTSSYLGVVNPGNYENKSFEATYTREKKMEDITIWFPRNEHVENLEIEIEDDAEIEEPTPYKYPKPIVYYGSSITEGAMTCVNFNTYPAVISRHLDTEFYNYGFSGSARGELPMADFFCRMDMSIFVMDYDYNAPSPEFLRETHEPFFLRIREKRPDLPIVMLTRPTAFINDEVVARRKAVLDTYENALKNGDRNVYFIDGTTLFGDDDDKDLCWVDCCHPNDLGFRRMSEKIEPVIRKILEK